MAKKSEVSAAEVEKFLAKYAKDRGISEAEAKRRVMSTGVSRLRALSKHQASKSDGGTKPAKKAKAGGAKKAAKKAPARGASAKGKAKAAAKKAPRKAAKKAETVVSEGEEG